MIDVNSNYFINEWCESWSKNVIDLNSNDFIIVWFESWSEQVIDVNRNDVMNGWFSSQGGGIIDLCESLYLIWPRFQLDLYILYSKYVQTIVRYVTHRATGIVYLLGPLLNYSFRTRLSVVYFDQCTGALYSVCWSKSMH